MNQAQQKMAFGLGDLVLVRGASIEESPVGIITDVATEENERTRQPGWLGTRKPRAGFRFTFCSC